MFWLSSVIFLIHRERVFYAIYDGVYARVDE
jgi:hypothetical protein